MSSADLPFFPKNRGRVSRPDPRKPRGRECFSSGRTNKPVLISFLPKKKVSHNCTLPKKKRCLIIALLPKKNGKAVWRQYTTAGRALATYITRDAHSAEKPPIHHHRARCRPKFGQANLRKQPEPDLAGINTAQQRVVTNLTILVT
jgi:hypothetical protein